MLTSLLPALVERDLEEFGGALTRIQQLVGDAFATVQGGRFHPRAAALVEALLAKGRPARARARGGRRSTASPAARRRARALADRMAGVVGDEGSVELVSVRQPRRPRGAVMRLLVSVVDAGEARAAAAAGADIVDVKNPAEGSLGAPSPSVIAGIRAAVPAELPVSAAIGDMPNLPGTAALAALGAAHSGAAFVKVGLWGASTEARGGRPAARGARGRAPDAVVVAGAYADARRVPHAPLAPELLPRVARAAGVDVCLLDTAVKDGRGLLDWLSPDALTALVDEAHELGLRGGAGRRAARGGPAGRAQPPAPTSPASARPRARGGLRSGPLDPARVRALRAA